MILVTLGLEFPSASVDFRRHTGGVPTRGLQSSSVPYQIARAALRFGLAVALLSISRAADVSAGSGIPQPSAGGAATEQHAPIPFSEIGAKATADYKGDAIGISATSGGADLYTGFQKLSGSVTAQGLQLESADVGGGGLRLVARSIGRECSTTPLSCTGSVSVGEKVVTFTRPGLTE